VAVPLAWGLPYFASHWGSLHPDPLVDALQRPAVQAGIAAWVAAVVFVAAWLLHQAGRASERTLRWDGQDWVLPGAGGLPDQRGTASLMLDLGPWLLVRFLPHAAYADAGAGFGAGTWLPLHMAGDLARWATLRGALWSGRGRAGRRA
jgi:hypothetical protein